ncbi:bactofilin family protein [Halomonas llamarensis]|uniref:Polymer-forming cytoskeletal protein n=1 Tax=Halomonas llamarensis TaxID=2945104 RepID=A0ABT0SPS8_9GAMM|nr:polymer-forming cytoskeletal protein [Halomonas llamarensis]MCL7929815.1 polymer-forming cytoskeletal protein [Halomonas llamarensis]
MAIESWLIVIGVTVMTMIIFDGKRKKKRNQMASADTPMSLNAENDDELASNAAFSPDDTFNRLAHDVCSAFGSHRDGSHLGVATQIRGKIIANEGVSIKGRVVGAVIARNQFIQLSSSSVVNASLESAHIFIDGHLEGDINASQRVTLMSGAKVRGAISTNSFTCHEGANVNGSVLPSQE